MAIRARVSEATVSRALRGLRHVAPQTGDDVRRAAAELGFTPSRSAAALASGRTRIVSVVLPSVGSWFFASVLEGVDGALRAEGYAVSLVLLSGSDQVRRRLTARTLREAQASAHVVIAFDLDPEERAVIAASGAPVVTVGGVIEGVRGVGIREIDAAHLAVEHLVALGHRRIGHVGVDREAGLDDTIPAARRQGWLDVLADLGVQPESTWYGAGAFQLSTSRDAARLVLSAADRPTAIFAASDESAFGVLLAAAELGLRVPQDLSVVGIDDHPYSEAHGLTTVHQSPAQQGALAEAMLLADLGVRRRGPLPQPVPFELVVRTSTAPPR